MKTISRGTYYARRLRGNQTDAEKLAWSKLRGKRFEGIKFKRQQPIGEYIVDFVSFDKMLIIEIDGGQHNEDKFIEQDLARTKYLEGLGYKVLRFWNNDMLKNVEGVFDEIRKHIPSLQLSP